MPNKALHRTAIPLRSIAAGELCVGQQKQKLEATRRGGYTIDISIARRIVDMSDVYS